MKLDRRRLRSQILTCFIFYFYFQKKSRFHLRRQAFRNTLIAEEELNGTGIDEIGNLEDLPRFVLVNEECRNLEVVHDCGELTKNINQKKKSDVSQSSQALRGRRGRGQRGRLPHQSLLTICPFFRRAFKCVFFENI